MISFEDGVQMKDNIHYWKDAPLWDKESIDNATKDWFKYLKMNNRKLKLEDNNKLVNVQQFLKIKKSSSKRKKLLCVMVFLMSFIQVT